MTSNFYSPFKVALSTRLARCTSRVRTARFESFAFRSSIFPLAAVTAIMAFTTCGSKETKVEERERELAAYSALTDTSRAPEAIRTQAKSVVLIETSDGFGTGFWVKIPSLGRIVLATNFHVIGNDVCSLQGCYVTLVSNAERSRKEIPRRVYAVPAAASSNYDVAFYDVYGSKEDALAKRSPLQTATSLTLDPAVRPRGTLYVVGHPAGGLKKVSEGILIRNDATDSRSTNMTLQGNSGSPVLDSSGRLVGLLWGGQGDNTNFSATRIVDETIFTRNKELATASAEPSTLAALFVDVTKESTLDSFVANSNVFLNSEYPVPTLTDDKAETFMATLTKRCDDSLGSLNLADRESGLKATEACSQAVSFLDCAPNKDGEGKKPIQTCVEGTEATAWQKRMERAAIAFDSVRQSGAQQFLFDVARLSADKATQTKLTRSSLDAYLAARPRELDDRLALTLLRVAPEGTSPSYGGVKIATFISEYAKRPGYESSLRAVFNAYTWLLSLGAVDDATFLKAEGAIYRDPGLRLHDKFYMERRLNAWKLLAKVEAGETN